MSVKNLKPKLAVLLLLLVFMTGQVFPAPAIAAQLPNLPDAPGGSISGKVFSPAGFPLPVGTKVRLFDMDGLTVRGEATPDPAVGDYTLGPLPNGMFLVRAVAPETSRFTDALPKIVSVMNGAVAGINFLLTQAQLHGQVFAPDGVTPAAAEVIVTLGNGLPYQSTYTRSGFFKFGGLLTGGYQVQAFPASDDPYWKSNKANLTITQGFTKTLDLTLTSAQIWGRVVTPFGRDVPLAQVVANNQNLQRKDLSSATGFFAIGGLPASGQVRLQALPPVPLPPGMLASLPFTLTLPGASNPYTLTLLLPAKVVTGTVTTNTGSPVTDARISAQRVGIPASETALTDGLGQYSLHLGPGLWALTVQPANPAASWLYTAPPQLVFFRFDQQTEYRLQNFVVQVADASVSGSILMPDGVSAPPFTVTVGLHNDEGVGRIIQVKPGVGAFQSSIPSGSYKVDVFTADPRYLAPAISPITIPANGVYVNLDITLLPRDALVTGVVSSDGQGVADVPVLAWRPGVPGSLKTLTGPNGGYLLAVSAGDWHIQPAPRADQPYLYSGSGADVTLAAHQLKIGVDFSLQAANATIQGVIVDSQNNRITNSGWASARQPSAPAVHNGAPIVDGSFTIPVPAQITGTVYKVSALMPPGSQYISSTERDVTAHIGQTTLVTLTLQQKTASIGGFLWDPRSSQVVSGVAGKVSAWDGSDWAAGPIDKATGAFLLDVAAGLWRVNYTIDPQSDYAKLAEARNVAVQDGQNIAIKLPVTQKDASVQGTVYDPDGAPLSEAAVWVKGIGPVVENIWLQTKTDAQGNFTLRLPHGYYRLSAAYNQPGWIAPKDMDLHLPDGASLTGQDLHFTRPDLTISGTISIAGAASASGGEVHVWAWSDDGGFVSGKFPVSLGNAGASGTYLLNISGGTTWHLGAVYKEGSAFWSVRAVVPVAGSDVVQDLALTGPHNLPAPVVVTFDASAEQTITLADGTSIFIPAGALPAAGTVTLHIVPLAALPSQKHANVLRYGYAFLATDENGQPIEQHFNQDLVITFHYNKAELLAQRVAEAFLRPAYFSTTTNRWTFPDSYVVDTLNNQVSMQIDHFTDFALTATQDYPVYLPLMSR